MSDSEDALRAQYATDANLQARIALHSRFSTNPTWHTWIFERERPAPGARVLEVGCGPATLWRGQEIDPSWSLTLTDFSQGMVEAAQRELGGRAQYDIADVQELPFADGSFDVVIANHMLYHVPDLIKALSEIRRVLTNGGAFHASTIGRGYLAELDALADIDIERYADAFGLETGPPQLEPFFENIRVERFDDRLDVTDPDAVLDYIRSSLRYDGHDLGVARATVETAIHRYGAYAISKPLGVISATSRPSWRASAAEGARAGFTVISADAETFTAPSWRPDESLRRVVEVRRHAQLAHSQANLWRYPPGSHGRRHVEPLQEEVFCVLEGTLAAYLGDPPERHLLHPRTIVIIEPGTAIQFRNESDQDAVFFAYGAPHQPLDYQADILPDAWSGTRTARVARVSSTT